MNPTMDARAWSLLVVLSLLWGAAFILTEVVLEAFQPFTVVLGRLGFAALALLIFVYGTGGRMPASPRIWGAFLVMGTVNNLLPFSLIVWGQTHIEGGLAAILIASTPLFSVLLAHVLIREEPITASRLAGVVLGFAGVSLLMAPEVAAGLGFQGLGQVAVLAAAVCYACAAIYGRRNLRSLPASVTAAGQVTCSSLLVLPLALWFEAPWRSDPTLATWAALLGLSLLGTALAYGIYFRILATAGATNLMLVTFLVPPSAITFGALFLGERLAWSDLGGLVLILAGLAMIDGRLLSRRRLWA